MKSIERTAVAGLCLVFILLAAGTALGSEKGHQGHADTAMTMHHMHMMINHAVEMAAEGSSMLMLGQMDMAKGIDEISVKHG